MKLALGALIVAAAAGSASATFTFATFADPSVGPVPPMFVYDGVAGTLNAGWSTPGLNLLTPGSSAPDFANAKFNMPTLVQTGSSPFPTFGAGAINFVDASNNPLFTISFTSAFLTGPIGFGGSDLIGNNVVISGPIVDFPLTQESFSFSFSNQVLTGTGFTATAAFTSSAVPAPSALAALGLGVLASARRRRA